MSIFKQFGKSLYSPKDIARFRFQKLGKAILYIFLLSLLSIIPEMAQIGRLFQTELTLMEETVTSDIPNFTIKDGQLQAEITKPIIKEQNQYILYFDPNAAEVPNEYAKEQGMFFLKEQVKLIAPGRADTYPYNMLGDTVIEKQDIQDFLSMLRSILPIVILMLGLFLYILDLFISFLSVTLLAMIGQFMAGQVGRKLNYKQAWVLCVYSTTIPVVFFMIMTALNITVQYASLIFTFVTLFIFYLTIKEIPAPKEKEKMPL